MSSFEHPYLPRENEAAVAAVAGAVLGTQEFDLQPFDSKGFMTRVYSCQTAEGAYILRHGTDGKDFVRDKLVAERYGDVVRAARVLGIKVLDCDDSVICVSELLPGDAPPGDVLAQPGTALHASFNEVLQQIHTVDVSDTRGYGWMKPDGYGAIPAPLRGLAMRGEMIFFGAKAIKTTTLDNASLRDIFCLQWSLQRFAIRDKSRRLAHGDLKPDNLLSDGREITGVIDWARAGFYDPAFDLGILHARRPGLINNKAHAEAIKANPDTILRRVLYYAISESLVGIGFFGAVGHDDAKIEMENRLLEIMNEAETA